MAAHAKFPPESVPCSLKLEWDQPIFPRPATTASLGKGTKGRLRGLSAGGRNISQGKMQGGNRLLPTNPSRVQHEVTKAQKLNPCKAQTALGRTKC